MPERRLIKNNDTDDLKKLIFRGLIEIDDPVDSFSKHALIHDAVIMNREEFFEFLVNQGANLMVRDVNGYTPLLKAASLGRTSMVKRLVEAGVDPRHMDPYGNTSRDKATLYNKYELVRYLKEMEHKANQGELKLVDWKAPEKLRRSGRYITMFDY